MLGFPRRFVLHRPFGRGGHRRPSPPVPVLPVSVTLLGWRVTQGQEAER
jgi:hypothetical protein